LRPQSIYRYQNKTHSIAMSSSPVPSRGSAEQEKERNGLEDEPGKDRRPMVDMKEEDRVDASEVGTSIVATTTTPSSVPSVQTATSKKRKRKDHDDQDDEEESAVVDVASSLNHGNQLVESPERAEFEGEGEKKAKRLKMPEEAKDTKITGKGKKTTRRSTIEGDSSPYKALQSIVEPLSDLKKGLRTSSTAVSSLLNTISGSALSGSSASNPKNAGAYLLYIWGKLITQQPKNMAVSVSLSGPWFCIGGNPRCNLTISDPGIGSSVVCKLQNSFSTGVAQIEGQTSKNILFVNLRSLKKGVKQPIKNGDEISIVTKQQTYAFTFQKVRPPSKQMSSTPLGSLPSLSLLSGQSHHLSIPPEGGVTPPSTLGTSSTQSVPPSSSTSSSIATSAPATTASTSTSSSSSQSGFSNIFSLLSSGLASSTHDSSEPVSTHDNFALGGLPRGLSSRNSDIMRRRTAARGKLGAGRIVAFKSGNDFYDGPGGVGLSHMSRPMVLSSFETTLSGSTVGSSITSQSASSLASQKKSLKEELAKSFVSWRDIRESLDDFPYYLDNDAKELLLNSAFAFIKKPDAMKHITDLPSISRRILLAGPPGSEMCQETLVRALARRLEANLFVFEGFKTPEPSTATSKLSSTPPEAAPSAPTFTSASSSTSEDTKSGSENAAPAGVSGEKTGEESTAPIGGDGPMPNIGSMQVLSELLSSASSDMFSATRRPDFDHMDDVDACLGGIDGGEDANEDDANEDDGDVVDAEHDDMESVFDDMDGENDDSDADEDPEEAEHASWFGRRPSDILKSRRSRYGPLYGLGERSYLSESLDPKHEERERQEKLNTETLFELLTSTENLPCILYLKDTEKNLLSTFERYSHFRRQLDKVTAPLVVIGSSIVSTRNKGDKVPGGGFLLSKSGGQTTLLDFALFDHLARIEDRTKETSKGARILARLLPNKIAINPPKDGPEVTKWTKQITKDQQNMRQQQNRAAIQKVIDKNNLSIIGGEAGLKSRQLREQILTNEKLEKIVGWAVGHHIMTSQNKGQDITMDGNKLMLPSVAIDHGIRLLNRLQPITTKVTLKDVQTDNDFERKLLAEAIPPNELGVRFEDIGALDKVKNTLKELVMLPLQRPELFRKGNLTKPCKGILLFGPPGTGKTMLAKAVATESGANFINCSMSSIGSKWFGEGEKYARAVFTLASKISPCVVFIDEVDSILGSREKSGEHEAMRKIKNEFMSMWDGLKTKENERVIVMAATNRPFDLDDAVLRRMPRRLLVDLPDAENRQKILRVILASEDLAPEFDFKSVSDMTEGFSGSDLKNLCISAAYIPIREIIEKEKKEGKEAIPKKKEQEGMEEEEEEERETPVIRALTMEDFAKAKKENSASVHEDARAVSELRKWNEMYGEGGNARGKDLTYFL